MLGIPQAISSVTDLLNKAISTAWPTPEAKASAAAVTVQAAANAAITQLQASQAVMLAEASSQDGFTSRARPSMLYVFYILLISAVPMGIVAAISPETAENIAKGFGAWLSAIPGSITDLATYVMLGYIGGRSVEKIKGVAR